MDGSFRICLPMIGMSGIWYLSIHQKSRYIPKVSIGISDRRNVPMLDGVSLDQLRAFIASADEGSFSAAARKLHRAQSWSANWSAAWRVRSASRSLTVRAVTPRSRRKARSCWRMRQHRVRLDFMKARARGMASGLEPELSVVVDVLFPIAAITDAAKEFRVRFPAHHCGSMWRR